MMMKMMQSRVTEYDEPSWVMDTISKVVLHRMEKFRWKEMKLDVLPQPGIRDTAHYFHGIDWKYDSSELHVLAVFNSERKMI